MGNSHQKDHAHFATAEGAVGPLEAIFKTLDFNKPLVFGTFAEASTNVGEFMELALEYGVEHLGWTVAATSVDSVKAALRRMEIQDSTGNNGVEGIRQLGPRHDEVHGDGERRGE